MRRAFLMALVAGSAMSGAGCFKHIAGKCDCTYDPADAVLPAPSNPYFPGATFTGPVPPAVDEKKKVAPEPKPAVAPATPMALPVVPN
jgi:hypothetical protein